MKRKIFTGILLLVLAVGAMLTGLAGTARAKEPPSISDTYKIDGITYYNVNSQNFNSDKRFYVDVISAKHSSLGGRSLGELWLMAAAGLGTPTVVTDTFMGITSEYLDKLKQGLLTGKLDSDYQTSNSYYYEYSVPAWSNSDGGYVETSAVISEFRGMGVNRVKYTVRFSDFRVGALLPADEGLYVSTTTETGSVKNVEASSVKNDTRQTVSATQSLTRNITESLTSTVNHSSSYSFTEGLKVGFSTSGNALFAEFKITGELSTSFTQSFSDGWSKSEGTTKSYQRGSNVSVTLPPYTNVILKQGDSETTTTTRYNCPVIVGYKATITIEQIGVVAPIYVYTFGSSNSNARKDLNHRAFEEGTEKLDEQGIKWETILADNDFKDAIQKITLNVPMSGSGASVVYTTKTTYSEIAGLAPLYPLAYVQLGKPNVSFIDNNNVANMKVGVYSYADYLPLNGYNSRNAEYHGFDKSKGSWVVVDESMREISGSDAPVVLEKEAATGNTKYKAVKPGKCYLKYLINENAYPTGVGSNTYTKNSDIQTALLEINVLGEEITYEITGSYTGRANSEPESLEGNDKLSVAAYDADDMEVECSYIWQKRELKGISLTSDGIVTFTKPGKYHVRVKDQGRSIYSDWVLIEAEYLGDDTDDVIGEAPIQRNGVADEGTVFVVSGTFTGGVSNDAESLEGAGKLEVAMYDSTGKEEAFTYTWEAGDNSEGMTLDAEGSVSFTKTGTYYVRVRSGTVYSDWVEIRANEKAPARIIFAPTATMNTYDGTSKELLNEDAKYEGGTIVYGLGSDDINTPNEYSSEIPTATNAGTYYAWCKIIGDEKHDDSEPVCISVKINSAADPEPEPEAKPESDTKPNDNSNNPGSSGGGCDAGISVLGIGILLSALILRRKAQ